MWPYDLNGQQLQTMLTQQAPVHVIKVNGRPSLQDLDLEHPGQTAETLYQQQGKDIAAAKKSVMDNVSQFLAK